MTLLALLANGTKIASVSASGKSINGGATATFTITASEVNRILHVLGYKFAATAGTAAGVFSETISDNTLSIKVYSAATATVTPTAVVLGV